jgi:uncharacterized membrane protein YoaK (UPF0700 family)
LESTDKDWKKQTERLHDWGVQIIVVIACINGAVCDVCRHWAVDAKEML